MFCGNLHELTDWVRKKDNNIHVHKKQNLFPLFIEMRNRKLYWQKKNEQCVTAGQKYNPTSTGLEPATPVYLEYNA